MPTLANSEDLNSNDTVCSISQGSLLFALKKNDFQRKNAFFLKKIIACGPSIYTMDHPDLIISYLMEKSIGRQGVKSGDKCHYLVNWPMFLFVSKSL